jgi:hypothetical protein
MQPIEGKSIWYAPTHSSNILNKIRVGLVVNNLLQYAYLGSYGVIHASSSYYIPKTLEWILEQPFKYFPGLLGYKDGNTGLRLGPESGIV